MCVEEIFGAIDVDSNNDFESCIDGLVKVVSESVTLNESKCVPEITECET